MANVKCPFCTYKYLKKTDLYTHMEKNHNDQLNDLSPAQIFFNHKNKKSGGKCIICSKSTKWIDSTERYERICDRTATNCKEKYRQMFRERMIKVHGTDNLLNEPEMQKKMLGNRKISGEYKWEDGTKTSYTGSYEKEFIEFLDVFLKFKSTDVMSPAPQIFYYTYKGKKHFYIPDFYIPSINTIIEIKSFTNNHYRARDIGQEKVKDKEVLKSSYNYIKINDKEYDGFYEYLMNFKS